MKKLVVLAAAAGFILWGARVRAETVVTYHLRMDGNVPRAAVLFVGDSITQGLCVAAVTERGVNYGVGGDTTAAVLERLSGYESRKRVRAVVLAAGVNDIARGVQDDLILENYRAMLSQIPETVPVVLSAVLPVEESLVVYAPLRNARIAQVNQQARALCASRSNCVYVDSGGRLKDAKGMLAWEFHTGDGIHLSTAGYAVWIADLARVLESLPDSGDD